ncbi:unnamed protein product [Zymoseptoria tritici ST99CH_1E4]|uniref:2-isopropylmalate synthase n=1 Tax=Zymoseptoria tritici ST99CH_1E4 TaxID=1276532 RepID=A0A2H1GIY2_ZYMTR|nr:unnamed protein product [Zymoseptoria tritici ST99CH_1E4]
MTTYQCCCGLSAEEKYGGRDVGFSYPERKWPNRTIDEAPVLLSCDLRDGNQSLGSPMTFDQKMEMFLLLVALGFKEIEVGFPCANTTEFDFVRYLVDTPGLIPDDVWIQVLSPCREDAIRTTIDSVRGARQVLIFTYLPSSDLARQTVLGLTEAQWIDQAVRGARWIRSLTEDDVEGKGKSKTRWRFGFGFEDFASARAEAVIACADAISAAWQPSREEWIYLGVASSVEVSQPNVFADQVEHFSNSIARRDCIRLAVHAHNDRGTAVASAELACLAGAQRVEGCLFGNGERAGNLDLVTFALNLLARGIDPTLDLRRLDDVRGHCERLTGIPVHLRAPYAGDYSFRAFSGGHQDAISKGMHRRAAGASSVNGGSSPVWPQWRIPYLPIDPAEVGRSIYSVMGITSQSGKAGVAMAVRTGLELDVPVELARAFSRSVKQRSLDVAAELSVEETCACFLSTFRVREAVKLAAEQFNEHTDNATTVAVTAAYDARTHGTFVSSHPVYNTSGVWTRWSDYLSTSTSKTAEPLVASYIRLQVELHLDVWGVGIGQDEEHARMCAAYSAVLARDGPLK